MKKLLLKTEFYCVLRYSSSEEIYWIEVTEITGNGSYRTVSFLPQKRAVSEPGISLKNRARQPRAAIIILEKVYNDYI